MNFEFVFASIVCAFAVLGCCYGAVSWGNCSTSCVYCVMTFSSDDPGDESIGCVRDEDLDSLISASVESIRIIIVRPPSLQSAPLARLWYRFTCRNSDECKRKYESHIKCLQSAQLKNFQYANYTDKHRCPCNDVSRPMLENGDKAPPCVFSHVSYGCIPTGTTSYPYPYCYWNTKRVIGCATTNISLYNVQGYAEITTAFDDGTIAFSINATISYELWFPASGETVSMQLDCPDPEDYNIASQTPPETTVDIRKTTGDEMYLWGIFGPVGAVFTIFLSIVTAICVCINCRRIYLIQREWSEQDAKHAKEAKSARISGISSTSKKEMSRKSSRKQICPAPDSVTLESKGGSSVGNLSSMQKGMEASERSNPKSKKSGKSKKSAMSKKSGKSDKKTVKDVKIRSPKAISKTGKRPVGRASTKSSIRK